MADSYAFPVLDSSTVNTLRGKPNTAIETDPLVSIINTQETANIYQGLNTADATSNAALTYGSYFGRNVSIRDVATTLTEQNREAAKGGARDTYARQSEINEWQAQNKLDTLFFFQIAFLYFTLIVVCLYLRQSGIFGNAALYGVVGVGLLIVIGVLWNRASYTQISRDKRYWNRRYLGLEDAGNLSAKLQCSLGSS